MNRSKWEQRRSFLKSIVASVVGVCFPFRKGLANQECGEDTVLTLFSPTRVRLSSADPKDPPQNPRAAKYWYNTTSGSVFGFEENAWRPLTKRKGKEVVIASSQPIGHMLPDQPDGTLTAERWSQSLPALDESMFNVKCESCRRPIDLRTPKLRSSIEQLPSGAMWEHIHHVWDNIPIEVNGNIQYYRLCETCLKNATLTYDV
ncbi:hypothetical protein KGP36_02925 [Patescibacteria group bacterium]|nr:hypothetical protein [Patescibacteria group bacterium]